MRAFSSAISLLLLLATNGLSRGGDSAPAAERWTARQLAGSYYRGTGLHVNVTLDLKESGDYTADWHGCITEVGSATGKWSVSGSVITLTPTKEIEEARGVNSLQGTLRQLHIVRTPRGFVFIPDLKDKRYLEQGITAVTAFHKQEPKTEK